MEGGIAKHWLIAKFAESIQSGKSSVHILMWTVEEYDFAIVMDLVFHSGYLGISLSSLCQQRNWYRAVDN
jgi:hypothetical protein